MAATIVVPLDGSPLAESALPVAASIARRLGGTVLMLQVVPPPHELFWGYGDQLSPEEQAELLQESADNYLRRLESRLAKHETPVASTTAVGPVGETIVDVAERHDAAYIVMSTHGRGGLTRWMLGSVAGRVLHMTSRPLVIVPPQEHPQPDDWRATPLDRIVVPLDGSPMAEEVLSHVHELASLCEAELFLIRAASTVPPLVNGMAVPVIDPTWYDATREQAREYLQGIQVQLRAAGFAVSSCVGREPTAEAILDYADEVGAGLIAMTSHAREGLSRLILGSVTDRVIRSGQRPVLVTRMKVEP